MVLPPLLLSIVVSMRSCADQFLFGRSQDSQHAARTHDHGHGLEGDILVGRGVLAEDQRRLATGHRQINFEQDLRVEQRAVQLAM